ncbi:UNVERIFIED_CONTAM: hypothetical protein Sangu_0364900 [Sesamum angustifolium]|uniref:Uncharacterized protein n=1 Tax=Sesamum angustifolium TaxID=2727405 RepID=A0AAW2QRL7_9LAMI
MRAYDEVYRRLRLFLGGGEVSVNRGGGRSARVSGVRVVMVHIVGGAVKWAAGFSSPFLDRFVWASVI